MDIYIYIGCGPLTVTVTTRIITFLVGDPYKPSFPTVTVRGPYPIYTFQVKHHLFNKSRWLSCFFCLNLHSENLTRPQPNPKQTLLGGSSRTCKYLGSPPFISHEVRPFGRGPITPVRGTYDHHGTSLRIHQRTAFSCAFALALGLLEKMKRRRRWSAT